MLRRFAGFMFFLTTGSFAYAQSNSPTVWRATEMANSPATSLTLVKRIGGDPVAIIEIRRVRTLMQIQRKIEPLAGRSAELLIVEGKEPNAFSSPESPIGPIIGVNIAMLDLLGDDIDAYAAILGHEYAHLALRHRDTRQNREVLRQVGTALLGIFLARAGMQYSGTVADVLTTVVSTTFSRDEERAADSEGLRYALLAGYDPNGAVRIWERMSAVGGGSIPFLATHPTSAERAETMRRAVETARSGPAISPTSSVAVNMSPPIVARSSRDTTKLTGTLKKIFEAKTVTLGYRSNAVPLSYSLSGGQPSGYIVAVCQEIVDALRTELGLPSLRVEYRQSEPANRFNLIKNGTVDIDCGATANKLGRGAEVAFSNTFFVTTSRFLVKSDSGIKSIRDLAGRKLVSTNSTSNLKWLNEANEGHKLNATITSVPTHAEAFALVKSGAVDAFFMDDIILHLVRASGNDNSMTTVLEDDYSRDAFALMFQKDDLEFKEFVDQVLADRFKSGVMQRLYGQWFQQPIPALRSMNVNMSMNVQTKAVFDSPNDRP